MRPHFLNAPLRHTRTERTLQSSADYASALTIYKRERPLLELARWTALLAVMAFLGILLAWRI